MKNQLKYLFTLLAVLALFASCDNTDTAPIQETPDGYILAEVDSATVDYFNVKRPQQDIDHTFTEYGDETVVTITQDQIVINRFQLGRWYLIKDWILTRTPEGIVERVEDKQGLEYYVESYESRPSDFEIVVRTTDTGEDESIFTLRFQK